MTNAEKERTGFLKNTLFAEKQRMKRYNRSKKPWRSRGFLRASMGRRTHIFRNCLSCMVLAELIVIGVNDPGIFTETARRFHIGCVKEETVETADFGTLEDVPPSDKKDSGVTIDWKEGRVEFWRTEEKLRRENAENRPD